MGYWDREGCRTLKPGVTGLDDSAFQMSDKIAELLPGPEFEAAAAVSFAHRARDECGGGGKLGSQRSAGEPFEEVREYGVDRFEAFDCGEMNPAHPISSSSWRTSSYGGLS